MCNKEKMVGELVGNDRLLYVNLHKDGTWDVDVQLEKNNVVEKRYYGKDCLQNSEYAGDVFDSQ